MSISLAVAKSQVQKNSHSLVPIHEMWSDEVVEMMGLDGTQSQSLFVG